MSKEATGIVGVSPAGVWLRGICYVVAAMAIPVQTIVDFSGNQPINWPRVAFAAVLSGVIALRTFIDNSPAQTPQALEDARNNVINVEKIDDDRKAGETGYGEDTAN